MKHKDRGLACLGDTIGSGLIFFNHQNKLKCLMQKCEITLQVGFPSSVCLYVCVCVCVCVCVWAGEAGEEKRERDNKVRKV